MVEEGVSKQVRTQQEWDCSSLSHSQILWVSVEQSKQRKRLMTMPKWCGRLWFVTKDNGFEIHGFYNDQFLKFLIVTYYYYAKGVDN